jgi:predicted Zn-dependent protease
VIDDSAVNAFAVPGGFIYVTRGILAHFDSEAELASVLGHEIAVTARHSVSQMTRQQMTSSGSAVGDGGTRRARRRTDGREMLGSLAGTGAQPCSSSTGATTRSSPTTSAPAT